jgi:hypothetical protein
MEQGVFGRLLLSCGIAEKPTADCCSIVSASRSAKGVIHVLDRPWIMRPC